MSIGSVVECKLHKMSFAANFRQSINQLQQLYESILYDSYT